MELIREGETMCFKNHAMSIGVALVLVLLSGLVVHAQPLAFGTGPQGSEASSGVLACSNARFIFGQVSDSGKDQFMLDTFTGRLWRIAESGKLGTYLKPVLYCAEDGQCFPAPQDGPKFEKQSKGR
jgi:hypothetical protein